MDSGTKRNRKNQVRHLLASNDRYYIICPSYVIEEELSWSQLVSGDEKAKAIVKYTAEYLFHEAQRVKKNQFVFLMESEGYTFVEMKFWSDVFKYLATNEMYDCLRSASFTQIWACAPHHINMHYMREHAKKYDLLEGMRIVCTNNFEALQVAEYCEPDTNHVVVRGEQDKNKIQKLNDKPQKIKRYKFLFYNNWPKLNRVYFVGQIIRRNLHTFGLMSLNIGHDIEDEQKKEDLWFSAVEQFADNKNSKILSYFPETGKDVFEALVNNKEYTQSLKPLGRTRWSTENENSGTYDAYMVLGEDTYEHCQQCYFAIVTETKYLQDKTNKTDPHGDWPECEKEYPVTPDTLYVDCITFTEKTHKFHLAKMPFVLAAMPGSLKVLRDMGYKTFSPYINEAYDMIENDEDRAVAIATEIERLCRMSDEWWLETLTELKPRLEHNFNHIVNLNKTHNFTFII